jgi:hypothetical protein
MQQLVEITKVCNISRVPVNIKSNILKLVCDITRKRSHNEGLRKLKEYYKDLNYSDLNSLYNTEISAIENYKYYQYFLPWIQNKPVITYRDDAFITPMNDNLIVDKLNKIKNLTKSIQTFGYQPDQFVDRKLGHITGYYLISDNISRFYVVSGNHRIAVLASLGYDSIPFIYENISFFKYRDRVNFGYNKMPEKIYRKNVNLWPGVKSGFMKSEEAIKIFDKFIGT